IEQCGRIDYNDMHERSCKHSKHAFFIIEAGWQRNASKNFSRTTMRAGKTGSERSYKNGQII
ncbi:MAG: hypothetical protein UDP13_05595, partial [Butyricicoccus sp.]|nr:hypothetical protein [Butyricicoccus sp.]